jgi:hypothetical protein
MSLLDVKNRRKIFDAMIIGVSSASAYLIGFFQNLEMGAMTFALVLPCLFLIVLGFAHLVLRSGRKFDETVHDLRYQAVDTALFLSTMGSSYYTSISGIQSLPTLPSAAFAFFLLISLYLMAYRPNR